MIHSLDTITISRYAKFARTNKLRYLKRWYNIFPAKLFRNQIDEFVQDFQINFSGRGTDYELENEKQRIINSNKILQLIALYSGLENILIKQVQVNIWKEKLNLNIEKTDLKYFIERVEKLTGIHIKDLPDLTRLSNEIQRRIDKHAELFPEKKPENKEEVSFMALAIGVFAALQMSYDKEITLRELVELIKIADKQTKEAKKHLDKIKK